MLLDIFILTLLWAKGLPEAWSGTDPRGAMAAASEPVQRQHHAARGRGREWPKPGETRAQKPKN